MVKTSKGQAQLETFSLQDVLSTKILDISFLNKATLVLFDKGQADYGCLKSPTKGSLLGHFGILDLQNLQTERDDNNEKANNAQLVFRSS
jgi:hypothetical protein